jgi:hypothetical protein
MFIQLVRKLDSIVQQMEVLGENEMGVLHKHTAGRFHDAVDMLRAMSQDLKQDAFWPEEP